MLYFSLAQLSVSISTSNPNFQGLVDTSIGKSNAKSLSGLRNKFYRRSSGKIKLL